ncbi:carcinoembryonic antigen-related cell adhesion molecule 5-like [Pristis pectinata]|uniref:carcinoembryonic antigen-related cell adhesion molecule 5-like n=1 Tax=Pristis pectinata TaxID=685728 RepID=UPI00223E33E6|nr:carcinoembryonic antigen-related cell adhesion molecule 5-like [Pristis pectinata]
MQCFPSLLCVVFAIRVAGTGASSPTVNGTLGHSVSLTPGIWVAQDVAQVVWRRTSPRTRIVEYSKGDISSFGSEEYKQRVTLHLKNFSLEIRDLQREDTGNYEVTVTASSGAQSLKTVQLVVYEPVSGTYIMVQYTSKNCNLNLTCSVTSGDPTSFMWWRGGEAVGNDSPHHLWEHGETVEIHHTAEVEDVVYRCEARNPVSEGTAQIRLVDVCKWNTPDGTGAPPPTVKGTVGRAAWLNSGIAVGSNMDAVVWSRTSPRTRIAQYSKGHIEYFGSEEYKGRITLHPGDFSLEIRDLRREDAGDYEMTSTTGSGAQNKMTVWLEVSAPDQKSSNTGRIVAGVIIPAILIIVGIALWVKRNSLCSTGTATGGNVSTDPVEKVELKNASDGGSTPL